MSARWFRFYDDAINDPKVQLLPPELFRAWVNLLCLASKGKGSLPPLSDIAFALRVNLDVTQGYLTHLMDAGLLEGDADSLRPHNWDQRQFVSDNSTKRVQKHREEKRNVSCGDGETLQKRPQIQSTEAETDTKTEKEKEASRAVRKRTRTGYDEGFLRFWAEYPSRGQAQNPKKPAHEVFCRLVAKGVDPETLISAAKAEAARQRTLGKIGTEFVPMAQTWLRQGRFEDAQPPPPANVVKFEPPPGAPSEEELRAKYERGQHHRAGYRQDQAPDRPEVVFGSSQGRGGDGAPEWRGMANGEARKPGVRGLGTILREAGMGTRDFSHGPHEPGSGMDGPDEISRVV